MQAPALTSKVGRLGGTDTSADGSAALAPYRRAADCEADAEAAAALSADELEPLGARGVRGRRRFVVWAVGAGLLAALAAVGGFLWVSHRHASPPATSSPRAPATAAAPAAQVAPEAPGTAAAPSAQAPEAAPVPAATARSVAPSAPQGPTAKMGATAPAAPSTEAMLAVASTAKASQPSYVWTGLLSNQFGSCLDASAVDGSPLMWTCNRQMESQRWIIEGEVGQIRNERGGCLDVVGVEGSTETARLRLWPCSANLPGQTWRYDATTRRISVASAAEWCLDAQRSSAAGASVRLVPCSADGSNAESDKESQRWSLLCRDYLGACVPNANDQLVIKATRLTTEGWCKWSEARVITDGIGQLGPSAWTAFGASGPETFSRMKFLDHSVSYQDFRGLFEAKLPAAAFVDNGDEASTGSGDDVRSYESFRLAQNDDGTVSLKTMTGKYVAVSSDGAVMAERSTIGAAESFLLELEATSGKVSLRSASGHGPRVAAAPSGLLRARADWEGPWDKFGLRNNSDGSISLQSAHGRYLVAEKANCEPFPVRENAWVPETCVSTSNVPIEPLRRQPWPMLGKARAPKISKLLFINLKKETGRRAWMEAQADRLKIASQRIPAVTKTTAKEDPRFKALYERGCSPHINCEVDSLVPAIVFSHLSAIQEVMRHAGELATRNEVWMIMEDDQDVYVNLQAEWEKIWSYLPEDWDMVRTSVMYGCRTPKGYVNEHIEFSLAGVAEDCEKKCLYWGLYSYIINPRKVRRVLDRVLLPKILPIDSLFGAGTPEGEDPKKVPPLNIFSASPRLTNPNTSFASSHLAANGAPRGSLTNE
eukprot:TRINITY_DN16502_c0_g3_i1.p1 TRINITY_DN16502_c0_g3~~TRINITY_DN16502_c0_g3_i1.p1  ORF type:complete len:824 (-),score=165.59 TRINITY_DN16502_c0_g3_i1:80-2551(-)